MLIKLDLYETYLQRFAGQQTVSSDLFYCLFKCMIACDMCHDFMGSRGFSKTSVPGLDLTYFQAAANSIYSFFAHQMDTNLIIQCETFINYIENRRLIKSNDFFTSESRAKRITSKIMEKLGLIQISVSDINQGDCSGKNSVLRTIDIINRLEDPLRGVEREYPEVEVNVDMSFSTVNLLPILSSLLENARILQNGCDDLKDYKRLYVKSDLSKLYDASNVETIYKTFKAAGMIKESTENLQFDIKCGNRNIVKCVLEYDKSSEITKLNVTDFFTFNNSLSFVSKDNSYTIQPSKRGSTKVANNSVKGIVQYVKDNISSMNTREKKHFFILEQMVPKTLGDFLQVLTFVNPSITTKKLFVTGDVICNRISSLFNRYSIGEIKGTKDPIRESLGMYCTQKEYEDYIGIYDLFNLSRPRQIPYFQNYTILKRGMPSNYLPPLYEKIPSKRSFPNDIYDNLNLLAGTTALDN